MRYLSLLVVLALVVGGILFITLRAAVPTPVPPSTEAVVEKGDPPSPPLFEELTAASGIAFTYRNGEDSSKHLAILESLGGGVGLIDYDGDGLLDVFLPGGGRYGGANQRDILGMPSKLYRNQGKQKYVEVTESAGLGKLRGGKPWFYTHGCAVADYDRDGWPDLLVTGWGQVALFHNVPLNAANPRQGRCFEDVTEQAGLGKEITWATSAAFADLDGDGYPDLYLCQYVNWSWENHPPCTYDGKTSDVCPPKNFSGLPHKLYRNTTRGTFADVSKEAGLREAGPNDSKGLGVLIVDVDHDGKPDLYVANDTVDNFLYLNRSKPGQIRLQEVGLLSGAARDDRGTPNGSMGLDAGDPERTGAPALWVTNYENELHGLYRNHCKPGRPFFHFCTAAVGIASIGQRYVGWGTAFFDADLDGWEDLFVSNGHAIAFPTGKTAHRHQTAVLLLNKEGKFREASARLGDFAKTSHLGRGVGFGDLDNDGRMDLVLNGMNEPTALLRGIASEDHHWLGVQLAGKDHACVVGARVVLEVDGKKQTRFIKGGGSYASSGDRRVVFGLGRSKPDRLTVIWPDGKEDPIAGIGADRYYRITRTDGPALVAP